MLSLNGFQPSLSSFMGADWPVRSLWPEITPLYRHTQVLQELKSSLEQLEKLQHKIFEEIQQMPPSQEIYPVACSMEKEGSDFALTLDTKDFSPEELSVRQVGRKLHVSGKSEKKQEDGKGSYSYRIQEFRRVFDLPQGVNPEAVTCSMADGKLYIQAPVNQPSEAAERMLPIDCQTVKTTQPETTKTQHNASTEQKTLNNPESTDYRPSLSSFMGADWPMRSLWPEITPLYRHTELLKSSLEQLEKLQHKIFEEIQQMPPSQEIYPVACSMEKEGSDFALTLDTKDFSPEELSVRQVGRKLHVSGKSEKKQEDGKGSYSYRIQEFRRVFDLPQGVSPEAVTCSMADGKLYIQAPVNQPSEAAERMLPIDCQTVKTTQPETTKTQHNASAEQKTLNNPESTEYRVQPSAGQS
ncbi:hypothetical protein Q8A67_022933 [Cirrhinus molitorella]|uniref:SHSP domain-containing protein n=1 Tax=Cirrhinus molitorella TaxID=172907 RepID=A0AA88P2N4_9TELE|nr:hypothetical protein Q8A67_022933 [Cirrhinus molitorella]